MHIANTPPFVKGVINLRGAIVPIVDLRHFMGYKPASYDRPAVVVILCLEDRVIGVVVDSVSDVIALTLDQILPVPTRIWSCLPRLHILGVGCHGDTGQERMLILLDMASLGETFDLSRPRPT